MKNSIAFLLVSSFLFFHTVNAIAVNKQIGEKPKTQELIEPVEWPVMLTITPPDTAQFKLPKKEPPKTFQCYYAAGKSFPAPSSQLVKIALGKTMKYQFILGEPSYYGYYKLICFVNLKKPVTSRWYREIICKNVHPGTVINMQTALQNQKNNNSKIHRLPNSRITCSLVSK